MQLFVEIKERSSARRVRIVACRVEGLKDAEDWDFWQRRISEQRLSALVAIRHDIAKVQKSSDWYQKPYRQSYTLRRGQSSS